MGGAPIFSVSRTGRLRISDTDQLGKKGERRSAEVGKPAAIARRDEATIATWD
jgi:hypothetical protein